MFRTLTLAWLFLGAASLVSASTQHDLGRDSSSGRNPGVSCEELGFSGLGLCSDCDQLAAYVKDSKLVEECRQCCVKDEGTIGATFTEAVLEVCGRRLGLYPDLFNFVAERAKGIPGLKVSYRLGATLKLIMQGPAQGESEIVRIDNWKAEHVEQFLREKLRTS